jgi:hypothetical protein
MDVDRDFVNFSWSVAAGRASRYLVSESGELKVFAGCIC